MAGTPKKKKQSRPLRRAGETALDVAVGGTALAADKAVETADKVIEKAGELAERAEERVEEFAGRARKRVRRGETQARKAAKDVRKAARKEVVGGGSARAYEDRTRDELYDLAVERDIEGRSRMSKAQLIRALRKAR